MVDLQFQYLLINNIMPKKIEIFENTLLKLLIRRGTDVDRKQVVLSEGELGYTVDTKRLYIGDGQTKGGIPVAGSSFLGSVPDVTIFTSAVSGDLAYDNDDNVFYTFKGGNPANIADWQNIGGTYSAGNGTISISNTNNITVNKLSAGNFSSNALGSGLKLDGSNKVALSSIIAIKKLNIEQGSTYLEIPSNISTNSVNFTLPANIGGPGKFLTSQNDGTLNWDTVTDSTITIKSPLTASLDGVDVTNAAINKLDGNLVIGVDNTVAQTDQIDEYIDEQINEIGVPPGAIMPFAMNTAPAGWLACQGQVVNGSDYGSLSSAIGTTYNTGGETSLQFRLPDLRGYFVRGAGVNSDGTTSGAFGVKQADELKAHTHTFTQAIFGPVDAGSDGNKIAQQTTGTTGSTGGTETRPKNIAMLYCIKY